MKNENDESKLGFKYEVICLTDDCIDSKLGLTIQEKDKSLSYFELTWDEVLIMIENLTHMNNINQVKKLSEGLKNVEVRGEVDDIMNSWGVSNES